MTGSNMDFTGTGVTLDSYKNLFGGAPKAKVVAPKASGVSPDAVERGTFRSQSGPAGNTAMDPLDAYAQSKANIYSQYSYLTGGPNWALIRQLGQQDKAAKDRYKTNRADVENMYGQLTQDVQADTSAIGQSYDTGMAQSGQRADATVAGLSNELAAQDQRRNAVAQSLGIQNEVATTDFGSTGRLNEAMGTVLGQNQNWQGFLQSQKGTALQQGANMATGVKNTQNQMTTAMKQEYDKVHQYYSQAINNEKSKQAIRKLTEEGSMLLGLSKQRLKSTLTQQFGLSSTDANKYVKANEAVTGYFDTIPSTTYQSPTAFDGKGANGKTYSSGPTGWHAMMRDMYVDAVKKSKGNEGPGLDSYLIEYGNKVGLTPGLVVSDWTNTQQ